MKMLTSGLACVVVGAAGCTAFTKDAGFNSVADRARSAVHVEVSWPRSVDEESKSALEIAELLQRPLTAQDAIQVALLGNRGLRANFEELRISEADLVQSGRLTNPRFNLTHAGAAGQYDIEETLSFNVLSLLTLPFAERIESQRVAATQDSMLLAVAQLTDATRSAFFEAVAAQQSAVYRRQVHAAAHAGGALAARMLSSGNWNALDAAHESAFAIEAEQGLAHATLNESAAREKLARLMGVAPTFQLAERLPDLPPAIEGLPDVERVLLENRIDLQWQRSQLAALARRLKLIRATRFVNVLDAGPARIKQGESKQPYERGYEVSLEIPIFDSGAARVRKAEAIYTQAAEHYAQAALEARSEIREAHAAYATAYTVAITQRDAALPLQKLVVEQNLLRYNASLVSVFDLLADVREQVDGIEIYIRDSRDFWIAKSILDSALLGTLKE